MCSKQSRRLKSERVQHLSVLIKHISCKCKCKFDGRKSNSNQWWNNDKCRCECKNAQYVKKIIFGIMLHVVVKIKNF